MRETVLPLEASLGVALEHQWESGLGVGRDDLSQGTGLSQLPAVYVHCQVDVLTQVVRDHQVFAVHRPRHTQNPS